MESRNKIDWRQFFISVLGTAIGVALTFIVSGLMERRNRQQAQRLTAIMVIHDIDNTIDILQTWKEQEEEGPKLFTYVQDHKDQKEPLPSDTLNRVLDMLVRSNSNFHFDTSKEKIFNSDVDVWQNLGNMKFIDNVQAIFYDRQRLLDVALTEDWFLEPIPSDDYMAVLMGTGWVTEDEFNAARWAFLKEKLKEPRVNYFMNVASSRISVLTEYIDRFTRLNDENKFIMGITDRELDDYVNSILNKGIALTRAQLPGRWLFAKKGQRIEYDFHSDNSFAVTNVKSSAFTKTWSWSGSLKVKLLYTGEWAIQGDSLILNFDFHTLDIQMDQSGIEVKENMQDSLSSLMDSYRDYLKNSFLEDAADGFERKAFKARMDASRDKMEWTDSEGEVRYLKRQDW